MTTIAQRDCCTMLGIDPKTLRHWLRHANMQFAAHPTDARLKCLTEAQVQQLATLHGRPLPSSRTVHLALPEAPTPLVPSQGQAHWQQLSEANFITRLACLERSVTTTQEQLAHLALELLHERQRSAEQRMAAVEAHAQQLMEAYPVPQALQETNGVGLADANPSSGQRLLPAEVRARSRVTALIEYGAQGQYVAVCPRLGVLSLVPDSPQWFDWLASLTSFRFVGPPGRFSACRASHKGQHTRCWAARRCVHQHDFWHYLGVTDRLTLASLEQAAAALQARVDAL